MASRRRAGAGALIVCALAGALPSLGWSQPLMRYNTVVESKYLLDRCGALTPARRAYLDKMTDLARRPLDYTPDQWSTHDAGLAQELARLYPSVPKERCDELVASIDQEMRGSASK